MTAPETEKPTAKCLERMRDFTTPCGREPYDEHGLCICHSMNLNKDRNAFNREIEAMLARKNYDFTKFVFPDDAWFRGMVFDGPVRFVAATFQGRANFFEATFQGEAGFYGAKFQGEANFDEATFQGAAYFVSATFQRGAVFYGATFQGEADFRGAKFRAEASFNGATFQGKARFWWATFQGLASFFRATFQGEATFWRARCEGEAQFVGSDDEWVFSREAAADFRWAHFHQPEKVMFQHVVLGRARFLETDVRRVDFTDVDWARRPLWGPMWRALMDRGGTLGCGIGWLCDRWPAWLKPRIRFAVWDEVAGQGEGKEQDYAMIGKLYRQLKQNYEEQRDPIPAGDFHFGEMHMRRLSNPPKNRFLRFLKRNLSFLAWYRWISGYGEDYILPLAWIAGVILVFALAFASIPALALQTSPSSGASHAVAGLGPHLLYSVMCFLLRGDKPLQPAYLAGHYLSVAEGILGPPLIAMFVLALNRRFKR